MDIFETVTQIPNRPCVVALGCFDGVHMGHRAVVSEARQIAGKLCLPLCVFTFAKPPKSFFSKEKIPQVCSTEDKHEMLKDIGVDILISVPPSREIFSMPAKTFVNELLLDEMKARCVVCGFNYTYGAGGKGDTALLRQLCEARGASVVVCDRYECDGVTVSSSLIRDAIRGGEMRLAAKYLGRPFSLSAEVVDGQHLARRLGFPTVNMIPDAELVLPRNGVYVTRVSFDGEQRYGITNVGLRPTVDTHVLCAETHLFDFDGDLYGKRITVEFLEYLRSETKFPSVEQMAIQVRKDIETAKEYLK